MDFTLSAEPADLQHRHVGERVVGAHAIQLRLQRGGLLVAADHGAERGGQGRHPHEVGQPGGAARHRLADVFTV